MKLEFDAFTEMIHPTPDHRALQLLLAVLPKRQRNSMARHGSFTVETGQFRYCVGFGTTKIYSRQAPNERPREACLQFVSEGSPIYDRLPMYDRMLAEYLLLTSDEVRYQKTANIFPAVILNRPRWVVALLVFNLTLLLYLGIETNAMVALSLGAALMNVFSLGLQFRSRAPRGLRHLLVSLTGVCLLFNGYGLVKALS